MPKVYAIDGITPVVHPSAAVGIPARVVRALAAQELRWKKEKHG
jgi:hypothetical protein